MSKAQRKSFGRALRRTWTAVCLIVCVIVTYEIGNNPSRWWIPCAIVFAHYAVPALLLILIELSVWMALFVAEKDAELLHKYGTDRLKQADKRRRASEQQR
jgi:hypothetical protein